MKKILSLLSFLIIFSNISFTQYIITPEDSAEVYGEKVRLSYSDSVRVNNLEMQIYDLKSTLWMEFTLSGVGHLIGGMYAFSYGGLNNPDNLGGFILMNTMSFGVDLYAINKLIKIGKKKKEIKRIKSHYE